MLINTLKRFGLLFFLAALLIAFFYFDLYRYLSFDVLKQYRFDLVKWTQSHVLYATLLFAVLYVSVVATSVPGAAFLTMTAGFLFGPTLGAVIVVLSATLGAYILYLAVSTAFGKQFAKKAQGFALQMEKGFQENAFSYLLFLRLVPIFPFWLVNIVPAILGVKARTFISATLIGIIPGSIIYVFVGNGLGHVFDANQAVSFQVFQDPVIWGPLVALGFLSLVPVLYKLIKNKYKKNA